MAPELTVNSQVSVVPVWPPRHDVFVVPMEASGSAVVEVPIVVPTGDVYWLKPVPVKVIVCGAVPAETAAEADRLDAVTVGATVEASPMPIAPASMYVARLPGAVLVTSREQVSAVGVPVTMMLSEIDVELLTVSVPRVTSVQVPEMLSVALEEKPLPVTVMGVVAVVAATAEGDTSLISLPETVKMAPEVPAPPSGFVTVTVYEPMVAGPPVTEFVGSTLTVRLVALP